MLGLESMCALTRDAIMLTGDTEVATSWAALGLDGRRPLRPFKLSVLTTVETMTADVTSGSTERARCADPGFPKLTFPHHADSETLLETAELASIPPSFVYRAVLVCQANILGIFLDRALRNKDKKESETHLLSRWARTKFYYLEESFAALAGSYSVVLTGGIVATHGTAALGPAGAF